VRTRLTKREFQLAIAYQDRERCRAVLVAFAATRGRSFEVCRG